MKYNLYNLFFLNLINILQIKINLQLFIILKNTSSRLVCEIPQSDIISLSLLTSIFLNI